MFKYRIYPSQKQKIRLLNQFKICKEIYNTLLGLNKKLMITKKFDFDSLVKDIKITCPEHYTQAHSQVLQNVSDRLHKAFDNFFNRIKLRKKGIKIKAGYPRFKSRIQSITYPQSGFKFVSDKRLYASKIGNIPIVLHRIPRGKIKTMTIKVNKAGQWFVCFSCELSDSKVIHPSKETSSIDVGIENFLTDHKGETISNPRFYVRAEKKLARLQRIHSKRKKGSKNREKSRIKVARQHLKVANQRSDFLHKLTHSITIQYGIIAGEKLNIKNMVRNHNLAKHILDVAWGKFYQMLTYKAVTSGCQLRKNPKTRGSSHRCSKCGFYVEDMPLSKRIFQCPSCGFVCHRDVNASNNHLKDTVGLTEISKTPLEIPPLRHRSDGASGIVELGTICDTV